MDITKLIKDLYPHIDDDTLADFLQKNKTGISQHILDLWDDYTQANQQQSEVTEENSVSEETVPEAEEATAIEESPAEQPVQENTLQEQENVQDDTNITEQTTMGRLGQYDPNTYEHEAFIAQIKGKNISLANGKVGVPYKSVFDIDALGLPEIAEFRLEGLEELGLHYDAENKLITGTPTTAGDHKIKFVCKRKTGDNGSPEVERIITLIVNPDPKSLWLNKPSDDTDPYYKPDAASEFVKVESTGFILKTERKDMVAASQRGRSHAHEGTFRDDDFALAYEKSNEWYILVAADGAGSVQYSRRGSQIACKTVVDVCQHQLTAIGKEFEQAIAYFNKDNSEEKRKALGDKLYGIVGAAVFKAQKNIVEEATQKQAAVKDYATTLLVSIAKKFKFGWFIGSFWVGDGGIGIYSKEKQAVKIMGEPDGGEFAGQTRFLTMAEITESTELYRRLRFEIVDDFTALVLMTDGVTDPKFETDANLQKIERWNTLWDDLSNEVTFDEKNPEIDKQLLSWLDFWSPGNHDDRTIAILF